MIGAFQVPFTRLSELCRAKAGVRSGAAITGRVLATGRGSGDLSGLSGDISGAALGDLGCKLLDKIPSLITPTSSTGRPSLGTQLLDLFLPKRSASSNTASASPVSFFG